MVKRQTPALHRGHLKGNAPVVETVFGANWEDLLNNYSINSPTTPYLLVWVRGYKSQNIILKIDEIRTAGSKVFSELEKDYNIQTTYDLLMCDKGCFALRINTINKTSPIAESMLNPSIDYLIDVLKQVKQMGLAIGYTPTFNKLTTVDDALVYHQISFYFLFEIND